jgi:quercetin dioxygenase-like cupin family protein
MATPNYRRVDDVTWEAHPRFQALQVKVLEAKATHPHASIMLVKVAAGGEIPEHVHEVETETAYVLSGKAELHVDGAAYAFEAGVNVSIPPGARHSVVNGNDEPLMIYAMHTPPIR